MTHIYLLCDIDGVLIPFPGQGGAIPGTHLVYWARFTGKDEPVRIWLNPEHGPLLARLVEQAGVEPVWCSTWRTDSAPQIGARLGLPPWPTVDLPTPPTDSSHHNGHLWKHPHAADHAGTSALVWIDDDFTDRDHAWAAQRNTGGAPTLLIEPDPHVGLLPHHVAAIIEWATAQHYGEQAAAA
jgi:hypothetical protein